MESRILKPSLGIDFGGVVVPRLLANQDLMDLRDGTREPLPGAFESIRRWNRRLEGRLWLLSRASPATSRATRAWLIHRHFERETGVDPSRWIFVRNREDKRDFCASRHVTIYVDDQKKNLDLLVGSATRTILFAPRLADGRYAQVWSWNELDRLLLGAFNRKRPTRYVQISPN